MSWEYALPVVENDRKQGSFRESATLLLKSLGTLGSQPRLRSPRLLAGIVSRAAVSISVQFKILRLLKDPVLAEAVQKNPRFPYKFLARNYLVSGLPISARAECLFHHYEHLLSVLPVWLLRQTLLEKITLFAIQEEGLRFAITMCLSRPADTEGELSLNLEMDDKIIYVMGFSIVPGRVAQAAATQIFLITRLQGVRGLHQELAQSSRILCHTSPIVLLIAALQGVGSAFEIDTMACISGVKQIAYQEKYAASFQRSYDDFFTQLGIPLNEGGFFVSKLPLTEKSLEDTKRRYRVRVQEKRALKHEIQRSCADFFARNGIPVASTEA